MGDDWFGHRHPWSGEKMGDRDEWIEWDHILSRTLQTIEDYSDQYGLLAWQLDDDAVVVDAKPKIHKFEQAKQEIENGKNYKHAPGRYFVPDLYTRRSDGHIQTFREWIEKMAAESEKDDD